MSKTEYLEADTSSGDGFVIVTPCYNEALGIAQFIQEIDDTVSGLEGQFTLVLVDDGSLDETADTILQYTPSSSNLTIKAISLNHNMGHQKAIKQGLIYADRELEAFDKVIVMDSDGEDDPKAIAQLVQITGYDVVFVTRGKRLESFSFKLGYRLYKLLFRSITGTVINHGNYSMVSKRALKSLLHQDFIHYAGFLSKQRLTFHKFQFDRKERIQGASKMNFRSLIFHGLYSLLEYSEEILFGLIKMFGLLLLVIVGLAGYIFYSKFVSLEAIPGWTSSVGASLAVSCLVIINTIILGLLLTSLKKMMGNRSSNFHELR